ncbi:MAG TPA: MFS transporter [Vicinamibacterales bacterium]|nr:MFS transporter [Vicinamibacterales bacterium]
MSRPRAFPVVLAGFSAFLDLYATQPLLPFLARTFHASALRVSLTVTAPAVAVAIAAPVVGRLADRFGLRRMIVGSAFALAAATLLAASAASLPQLIFWRFGQGLMTPGIFAITIAYIHEEWPAATAGSATAAYVSGTVVGGFVGRALMGVTASAFSWQMSFVLLGLLNLVAAAILWRQLPVERPRPRTEKSVRGSLSSHLHNRQLVATYAIGFCILCAQVATFTYITFYLAAPPFGLSTAALGWIFVTYLLGAVVTPIAGRWTDRYGRRMPFIASVAMGVAAVLLTLAPSLAVVIVGLSFFGTSVFVTQATASSHVGATATHGRGLAIGLYSTCYYIGGSVGSALPSVVWSSGGWSACVALIVGVQVAMALIAFTCWTDAGRGELLPEAIGG